jgi:hypothetical protein
MMPVSFEFLRGVLALLSLLFAFQAGRTLVAVRRGKLPQSRLIVWVVRAVVCGLGVIFPMREIDRVALGVWILAALAFLAGMRMAARQKKEEELHIIFPDDE